VKRRFSLSVCFCNAVFFLSASQRNGNKQPTDTYKKKRTRGSFLAHFFFFFFTFVRHGPKNPSPNVQTDRHTYSTAFLCVGVYEVDFPSWNAFFFSKSFLVFFFFFFASQVYRSLPPALLSIFFVLFCSLVSSGTFPHGNDRNNQPESLQLSHHHHHHQYSAHPGHNESMRLSDTDSVKEKGDAPLEDGSEAFTGIGKPSSVLPVVVLLAGDRTLPHRCNGKLMVVVVKPPSRVGSIDELVGDNGWDCVGLTSINAATDDERMGMAL
jgi:hypothetical protein